MLRSRLHALAHACAMLLACAASSAHALQPPGPPSQNQADADPTQADPRQAFASEVNIEVEYFGAGNVSRLGDWMGVRVRVQDTGTQQRTVLLRLSTIDADGDQPQQQREITTNPGTWQGTWLYMRLPFAGLDRIPVQVTAHEAIETGAVAPTANDTSATIVPSERVFRAGRLLGRLQIPAQRVKPEHENTGLMGVLGDRALGLRQYSDRPDSGAPFSRLGHELTQVAMGLKPATLPDRWMGLAAFETIVWGAGEVTDLREERARALVQWVQRGGHLIIVLPPVGQQWMNPTSNDVYNIMPAVTVDRRENADMLPYRPLITSRLDAVYPRRGVVHTFTPNPAAPASDAMPILSGPDGACVVVRRLVGAGAVTMIGLDLNTTQLSQSETIEADIFWHRILGRRGELLPAIQPSVQGLAADRRPWYVDGQIPDEIAITGRSALGALVAFVVFGLYWLVVGPVLFYALRGRDLHKHSWLGFIAGSIAFTILAWGLATLLRPQRVEATHLTILDHIYGQPTQRARMWTSLLIPRYGEARVSVGDPSGETNPSLSALAPWESPGDDAGRIGSFPDARGYPIDTRTPDALNFPVRATVKTLQADWAGPPTWQMIAPAVVQGEVSQLTLNQTWTAQSTEPLLMGTIIHNLPQPLTDVRFIVFRGQQEARGTIASAVPFFSAVEFAKLQQPWEPNQPLDIAAHGKASPPTPFNRSLDGLLPNSALLDADGPANIANATALERELLGLTFFHLLQPPDFLSQGSFGLTGVVAAQRRATHGMDLSRWVTQPCLIITGFVGVDRSTESPVPLFVDAQRVKTKGRTFVRWVYPLAPRPPSVISASEQVGRKRPDSQDPLQGQSEAGPR